MRYSSLFSGLECAWLAWHPLGWECASVAEIEPRACEVMAFRLNASAPKYLPDGFSHKAYAHLLPFGTPGTLPNFGDVSQVTADDLRALGHVDVLIGGSPCQDLSMAGKRAGLGGARSGLFHHQMRISDAMRSVCGTRWLVWENVPGALSSNKGRDFAVVVGAMAGLELTVPRDGWGTEGVAAGENGLVEWCVLDAQWFGVAQRRRRVFAVLDTGNWTDRSPVLLERDSLRGDSAPRREAGEGTAAGTLRSTQGSGDVDHARAGHLQCAAKGGWPAEVASTLNCAFGDKLGLEDQHALNGAPLFVPATAHTLRADGFDASEDGTGRGTPLVPVAFDTTQISSAANRSNPQPGDPCHPLAATGHAPALAFPATLSNAGVDLELSPTLGACNNGTNNPAMQQGMAVRRLTPRECERLQGVPDDWTLVPSGRKGKPMADGPRYKMLGNSFARPVIEWIGRQLERATEESRHD